MVFDYRIPPASLSWKSRLGYRLMAAVVGATGEPFRLFYRPGEMEELVRKMGFHHVQHLGPDEINKLYFANRKDGLRAHGGVCRILSARV